MENNMSDRRKRILCVCVRSAFPVLAGYKWRNSSAGIDSIISISFQSRFEEKTLVLHFFVIKKTATWVPTSSSFSRIVIDNNSNYKWNNGENGAVEQNDVLIAQRFQQLVRHLETSEGNEAKMKNSNRSILLYFGNKAGRYSYLAGRARFRIDRRLDLIRRRSKCLGRRISTWDLTVLAQTDRTDSYRIFATSF